MEAANIFQVCLRTYPLFYIFQGWLVFTKQNREAKILVAIAIVHEASVADCLKVFETLASNHKFIKRVKKSKAMALYMTS